MTDTMFRFAVLFLLYSIRQEQAGSRVLAACIGLIGATFSAIAMVRMAAGLK